MEETSVYIADPRPIEQLAPQLTELFGGQWVKRTRYRGPNYDCRRPDGLYLRINPNDLINNDDFEYERYPLCVTVWGGQPAERMALARELFGLLQRFGVPLLLVNNAVDKLDAWP